MYFFKLINPLEALGTYISPLMYQLPLHLTLTPLIIVIVAGRLYQTLDQCGILKCMAKKRALCTTGLR